MVKMNNLCLKTSKSINGQKWPYHQSLSRFAFLRKMRSLKTLLLLGLSILFHEIVRINVELHLTLKMAGGSNEKFSEIDFLIIPDRE